MSARDALALPGLPQDDEGPVFAEPWQAQAFALVVKLHQDGAFTWTEWAHALSAELAQAPEGQDYYESWLRTLEGLSVTRGLVDTTDLAARKDAWADAYRHTPHGRPVELKGQAKAL